eukprot:scaffold676_cov316-Pavlova_lutheri.AAC.65
MDPFMGSLKVSFSYPHALTTGSPIGHLALATCSTSSLRSTSSSISGSSSTCPWNPAKIFSGCVQQFRNDAMAVP